VVSQSARDAWIALGRAEGIRWAAETIRSCAAETGKMAPPGDPVRDVSVEVLSGAAVSLMRAASKATPDVTASPVIAALDPAPAPPEGTGPRDVLEHAEGASRRICDGLAAKMPHGWRFGLLLFSEDPDRPGATWLSNCTRESMVRAMRDLLARWAMDEPTV